MSSLPKEVKVFLELKERLKEAYPDMDDETLADTAEGQGTLHDRIASICRSAEEKEMLAEMLAKRIQAMQARKKRFEDTAEHLRDLALWAMQEAGIPKVVAEDLTISTGKTRPKVVINDLAAIPPHLVTFEPKADKAAILEELNNGHAVPGASLSNGRTTITIRSK